MVIRSPLYRSVRRQRGMLTTELVVAISIVALTVFPLALAFLNEQKLCRAYFHRAVAMEIVDGEMEALVAGDWRSFARGTHPYTPKANAVAALPPGRFELTVNDRVVRLEWTPARRDQGGRVVREVKLP